MHVRIALVVALATLAIMPLAVLATEIPQASSPIYDKPYLTGSGRGIAVGGYIDMELEVPEHGTSTFDQHRFIPFITGYVGDRVTVSAEIEFEHGGHIKGAEDGDTDGEIKLEYAVVDYRFGQLANFRGGVVLSPLGRFNVLHDSPLNDLTARPVVSRQLIPSTLSESGMGLFGDFAAGEEGQFDYEAYFVNGFDEGIISGDPGEEKLRLRSGRGSQKQDNNNDKSFVGRLGYSPTVGAELGLSAHTGNYDDADRHRLTIAALDGKFTFGPVELQGEAALADVDVDRRAYPDLAEKQRGAYGQVNWHVLHDALLKGSLYTLVARGDWMDYDADRDGDSEDGLTLGLNFRPTEETVFKLDYNWRRVTPRGGERLDAAGRLFFSVATYF
jgi:hypothetical protein